MKKEKLISTDVVNVGDWLIKASQRNGFILLIMINVRTFNFVLQYVDDIKKANIIIEYVIEKGSL
jgi:hypothetical protein